MSRKNQVVFYARLNSGKLSTNYYFNLHLFLPPNSIKRYNGRIVQLKIGGFNPLSLAGLE